MLRTLAISVAAVLAIALLAQGSLTAEAADGERVETKQRGKKKSFQPPNQILLTDIVSGFDTRNKMKKRRGLRTKRR